MKKIILLTVLVVFLSAVSFSGCDAKELSRSKAQSLIESSDDFRQPFTLPLMHGVIGKGGQGKIKILDNETETPAQAAGRKTNLYFEIYPQVAVANHLGLVAPSVKAIQSEQPKHDHGWTSQLGFSTRNT